MKPSVAKKAISFVLLFGLSGVGVSMAHAQSEKLEGINSALQTDTKNNQSSSTGWCGGVDTDGDGVANWWSSTRDNCATPPYKWSSW